jgi:hypothetical protein
LLGQSFRQHFDYTYKQGSGRLEATKVEREEPVGERPSPTDRKRVRAGPRSASPSGGKQLVILIYEYPIERDMRGSSCSRFGLATEDNGVERVALGIEHIDVLRGDENCIAPTIIQVERLVAKEFEVDPVIVADRKLQAQHSTERGNTLDTRAPARTPVSLAADLEIVRPDVDLGVAL